MTVTAVGCSECRPNLRHSVSPLHDHHYSYAWAPTARLLNDDEQIDGVIECVTGPGGWALKYLLPPAPCVCGSGNAESYREDNDGFSVEIDEHGQAIVEALAACGPLAELVIEDL